MDTLVPWLARPSSLYALGLLLAVGLTALVTRRRLLRRGDVREWRQKRAARSFPPPSRSYSPGRRRSCFSLILSGYVASMRAIRLE